MSYRTRQCNKIPAINVKHDFFKNTFFPSTIMEWNKLDWEIKNSESIVTFKKRILSFIRPSANSTFNCHNPRGIKLLSRLRLGLSHLREHKFKHSFQDSLNPFCSCGKGEVETSSHYLLHCSNYLEERLALLNTMKILTCPYYNKVIGNLLAFYFSAALLSTMTKTLLSSMPLQITSFQPEDFMNLYSAVLD